MEVGTWISGGSPPFPEWERVTPAPRLSVQCGLCWTAFLPGICRLAWAKQSAYAPSSRGKPWALSLQWASLVDISTVVGTRCHLHVSTERRLLKLLPGFIWMLPPLPFPCADFTLDPFTVVKLSHGSYCKLSPTSPPRELSWGLQLRLR